MGKIVNPRAARGTPPPCRLQKPRREAARDATSKRAVKSLGFFPTDMEDAHAVHDHLTTALTDDASTIANATAKPSIRLAALRGLVGATWRHHFRGQRRLGAHSQAGDGHAADASLVHDP